MALKRRPHLTSRARPSLSLWVWWGAFARDHDTQSVVTTTHFSTPKDHSRPLKVLFVRDFIRSHETPLSLPPEPFSPISATIRVLQRENGALGVYAVGTAFASGHIRPSFAKTLIKMQAAEALARGYCDRRSWSQRWGMCAPWQDSFTVQSRRSGRLPRAGQATAPFLPRMLTNR